MFRALMILLGARTTRRSSLYSHRFDHRAIDFAAPAGVPPDAWRCSREAFTATIQDPRL